MSQATFYPKFYYIHAPNDFFHVTCQKQEKQGFQPCSTYIYLYLLISIYNLLIFTYVSN